MVKSLRGQNEYLISIFSYASFTSKLSEMMYLKDKKLFEETTMKDDPPSESNILIFNMI